MGNLSGNTDVSKSWFCVLNNPEEHGFEGTPEQIVDKIIELWIKNNPQRTCAVCYCISADGLKHCHAVFEDTKAMRYTAVVKCFPGIHVEATKGEKAQAEDYINKRGKWAKKGEQIIYSNRHGEIKGRQGQRGDLDIIEELISQGRTPNEIMDISLNFRRFEKVIRDAYYRKRYKETPMKRNIMSYWHTGISGSGKSYTEIKLAEAHGEDAIYKISDCTKGFADKYNGEPILFIDEFRGQMEYAQLLTILDCYRSQIHARYSNIIGLWTEVHITSVYPPETVYKGMIRHNREVDTYEQLRRRINFMVYHYIEDGEYRTYELPMDKYTDYENLRRMAQTTANDVIEVNASTLLTELPADTPTPWDDERPVFTDTQKMEQVSCY